MGKIRARSEKGLIISTINVWWTGPDIPSLVSNEKCEEGLLRAIFKNELLPIMRISSIAKQSLKACIPLMFWWDNYIMTVHVIMVSDLFLVISLQNFLLSARLNWLSICMVPSETRIAKSFPVALLNPILNVNKSMKASVLEVIPMRKQHFILICIRFIISHVTLARRELFL